MKNRKIKRKENRNKAKREKEENKERKEESVEVMGEDKCAAFYF